MNLFLNPSLSEFQKLFINTENKNAQNLVVDYDGEVLIDPYLEQPDVDLARFKVMVRLNKRSADMLKWHPKRLRKLLNSLLISWNTLDYAGNTLSLKPIVFMHCAN